MARCVRAARPAVSRPWPRAALGKRALAAAARNRNGYLGRKLRMGVVDAKTAAAGARAGDAECLALLAEEADYLGIGFTGLIQLFSPQCVVMGGGVAQSFDLLSAGIHARIRRNAMGPFKDVPVVAARLGVDSGLIGAAARALA